MVTFTEARTAADLDQVYRLRFQIYCIEKGYEDATAHPDGRERDDDDASSWQFLCRLDDGSPIGTVRLIPAADRPLPLERCCRITDPEFDRIRPHAAEISRLALRHTEAGEAGDDGLPVRFLGLLRAAYQKSVLEGLTHVLAIMERRLWLLLRRHGIRFEAIGPAVHHHGVRRPYVLSLRGLERECPCRRPDVYRFLRDGLPEVVSTAAGGATWS